MVKIQTNKVYDHLISSNKKILIEQGGTRSGKTYNILLWIIFHYCTHNKGKIVTICRKTFPAVRATVLRDFMDIIRTHGIYREEYHNKSNSEYFLFGNMIEFISLDQPQKVRGRKRDLLYANEINELLWEDWQQLIFRTNEKIVGDFNPSDEYHWLYEKVITREDCDFYKTTYLDNPFLDQTLVKEIERLKDTDEVYWQVYGLGERAVSKSVIFTHHEIDNIPEDAQLISYGLDFGYTNDPTAMVAIYQKDLNLYLSERLYKTMMTAEDINNDFRDMEIGRTLIFADSAEPRLIDNLKKMGWNIRPSIKGQDSIRAGIDLLKRHRIHITSNSDNLIREFRSYKWLEDKSGKLTNVPEDKNNHLIDAARYGTYSILSKPNFGTYAIR